MRVGSVVVRKDGNMLRSGAEVYSGAIVVSIEPFVLISEGRDMKWSTLAKEDFKSYKDMVLSDEEMKPFFERNKK